ncbi:MAG: hypothetical protein PHV85_00025 [Desulfovibrionaceae bacterium]|nr:hypothetical protein [Desulfovibrionaceae bacterium]
MTGDNELLRGMDEITKAARMNHGAVLNAIRDGNFPARKRDGTLTGPGPWYSTRAAVRGWWEERLKLGLGSG